jgi:hypothetical protein
MRVIDSLWTLLTVVAESAKETGTLSWWRGHADASWKLVPGAFRNGRTFHSERNMVARFRAKAPIRRQSCPDQNDLPSWLALMQHYRLPTRLLDWTELPLVATFFAACELPEVDGVLWRLNPYVLNVPVLGGRQLQGPTGAQGRNFVNQAFASNAVSECKALALTPWESDLRMLLQGSTFTIHDGPTPLQEHPTAPSSLMSFSVPAKAKKGLLEHLALLGIRRSNLFPDLDNLAGDIAAMEFEEFGPAGAV